MKIGDELLSKPSHIPNHELLLHTITFNVSVDIHTSRVVMCDQPEGSAASYIKPTGLVSMKILIWILAHSCDDMCLLGLAIWQEGFFKLPFCTRSLVPSMPDIPSVISHPFQRVCCFVTGDPREWQGHLRHGMKTRVMVLNRQWLSPNPSARWPLSGREMDNSPGFTHANHTRTQKHTLNKTLPFKICLSKMVCSN